MPIVLKTKCKKFKIFKNRFEQKILDPDRFSVFSMWPVYGTIIMKLSTKYPNTIVLIAFVPI